MRIAVVIPHLNQPEALARCLHALAAGERHPDEAVVVDNGSHTLPDLPDLPFPIRLVEEPEPGPGPARNRGIAATTAPILAFIDADCIADRGWLAAVEAVFADPEIRIAGGDVRIADTRPGRMRAIEAYESEYAYRMERYIRQQNFTGTGNLAARRAVLEEVGPFRGLDVAEDRDWGRRATAAGHVIRWVPEMRVYHPARPDFRALDAKWARASAHDWEEARASAAGRARFALKTLAMAVSPLAEVPRVLRSDRLVGPRDRALALAGLVRVRAARAVTMLRLLGGADGSRLSGRWNRS